jgi:hypothetical protein
MLSSAVPLADPAPVPPWLTASVPVTPVNGTPPHSGAVVGPVDTIACPALDPAGFSNWIGLRVAPNVSAEKSASAPARILFMGFSLRRRFPAAVLRACLVVRQDRFRRVVAENV